MVIKATKYRKQSHALMDKNQAEQVFGRWHKHVTLSQYAHYAEAGRARAIHQTLSIPTVIIPTLVGTSLFAVGQQLTTPTIFTLGLLCVLTSLVASLQIFLRSDNRAELHLAAAARYGVIRREIEMLLATREYSDEREAEHVVRQLDSVTKESPSVSASTWQRVEAEFSLSEESYGPVVTREESIVAALKRYGTLPIGFLANTQNLSTSDILELVENLREHGLVEVRGGNVSLKSGDAR